MKSISIFRLPVLIILGLAVTLTSFGQTLPMPNVVIAPCYGSVGLTAPVEVDPVPGADGYIWDVQPSNSVLVDGLMSPVTTMLPYVTLNFISNAPVWKACVSAFSTCCTSPWNCFFIYNSVPIAFQPSNYTSLPPGITSDFGIYYLCLPLLGQHTIHWYVTGDITFSNGQQSITSGQDTTVVPLTFGPNFTGGTLCVYTVNQIGLSSDTICSNISALTSLPDNSSNSPEIFYNQEANQVIIQSEMKSLNGFEFRLNDMNGRTILRQPMSVNGNKTDIHIDESISPGIYIAELRNSDRSFRKKILINR